VGRATNARRRNRDSRGHGRSTESGHSGNEGLVFEWSPGITIEDENEAQIILDEPFEDEQIVDAHDEDIIFEENNMMEADNVDIGDQEENIMMEVGDDDVEDLVENTEVEEDLLCWSPRSYWIGDG
jgi:hypothetical protein